MNPAMAAIRGLVAGRHGWGFVEGWILLVALGWAAPRHAAAQVLPPDRIPALVDVATSKKSFQITPDTASSYFAHLATLSSVKRGETWRFVGPGAGAGVLWVVVTFQQGQRPTDWDLRDAELALAPEMSTGGNTFIDLCRSIGSRLRLPRFACQDNAENRVGWAVGRGRVGSLEDGAFENPLTGKQTRSTAVRWVILQGDAD
jgi:hypothetical protein